MFQKYYIYSLKTFSTYFKSKTKQNRWFLEKSRLEIEWIAGQGRRVCVADDPDLPGGGVEQKVKCQPRLELHDQQEP